MDARLLSLLVCPRDRTELRVDGSMLVCAEGHRWPVIEGIPFLVRDDVAHPHWVGDLAVDIARAGRIPEEWHVEPAGPGEIDPFVGEAVGATCGNLYGGVIGRLPRYPIPDFPEAGGDGARLLDVGCNWGRWTMAGARAGFDAVGIDPSPHAVFAARRVALQLGVPAMFLVADGRHLPFRTAAFDMAFSYSVLQHLAPEHVGQSAIELGRVTRPGGLVLVQMASATGVRSWWQQARRGFRAPQHFEVRYWWPWRLRQAFTTWIGPTTVEADAFLSLNAQASDLDLLRPAGRLTVRLSCALVAASRVLPLLRWIADSVWLRAVPRRPPQGDASRPGPATSVTSRTDRPDAARPAVQ